MSEEKLTRDDLVLLMESYRNMIIMHQTILDQSSKTIDKLDGIATKQDNLFSKQNMICNTLSSITEKIENTNDKLRDTVKKIDGVGGKIDGVEDRISNSETNISNRIEEHGKKSVDDNSKIISKIHLGWIGMGTIVLSLIGIIITISNFINTNPAVLP
jgi:uncharacterized protein YoxC